MKQGEMIGYGGEGNDSPPPLRRIAPAGQQLCCCPRRLTARCAGAACGGPSAPFKPALRVVLKPHAIISQMSPMPNGMGDIWLLRRGECNSLFLSF